MNNLLENYNCSISKDSVWVHAHPSSAAKSTFFYIQEAGIFKCRANYFTERENLDSFMILYTTSGSGKLKYEGNEYTVFPGQAFFIDCLNYNYYSVASTNIWDIYWIHFKGANSRNYYELFQKSCPPVVNVLHPLEFEETILDIISRHDNFTAETELICSKQILSLITELLSSSNSTLISVSAIPDYIQGIISTLEKNYSKDISLDDLSKSSSVSKFHLEREFKKYTGVSIHEYHIRIRINLAKDLLTGTLLSIGDISRKIGIDNISHFNSLFKKRMNDTPTSYRKKWQTLD